MSYLYRVLFRLVFIVSMVNGSTIYDDHFVGEDAQLQWTLSPPVRAPASTIVYVKNPVGVNVLQARGTAYAALGVYNGRVIYNGDTTKANMSFTLKNVAKSDAGAYSANYENKLLPGVILVIYVKPSPASISSSVPIVGKDLVLSCRSQSNSVPVDHDLAMTYTWFLNGADLPDDFRFVAANQQLTVKEIQRSDKGSKITCKAQETPTLPSDSSLQYTIDPECHLWSRSTNKGPDHYEIVWETHGKAAEVQCNDHIMSYVGPFDITINTTETSYRLLKGRKLGPIACSATCIPSCSYQWSHNGNSINTASGVLYIPSIQRVQNGTYTCTASNKHGTKTISVAVIVKLSPTIIHFDSRPGGPDVDENKTVHFVCETEGYPVPTVTIYFERNSTVFKQDKNLSTTLVLKNINCLLTGYYFCNAINEVGNVTWKFSLNVLCPPRLDHRKKIAVDHGIGNGENLNITGSFIANPPPTFTWKFRENDSQTERVLKNGTESFYYVNQQNDYISYGSRAIRTVTGEDHFGQYILKANNTLGSATLVQTVFPRLPPNPAIGIAAVCTSINTAEVMWISKYNGGANQHFRIGVKTSNDAMYTIGEKIMDPGENKIVRRLVYGLEYNTGYMFTVYAENKYGKSLLPKTLACVTPGKVNCQAEPSTTSIVLIVISTVLITSFVIGIAIRWFLIRRKKTPIDRQERSKKGAFKEQRELDSINAYQDLGDREQSVDKPYQELHESSSGSATNCKKNIYQDLGERDIGKDNQYQEMETATSEAKQDSKKGIIYDALGQKDPPNVYEEIKSQAK